MSLLPVNERNEMSEMGGMKPPGNFNPVGLEVATSWLKWSEQFEFDMKATEKDTKGSDVQVAILLTLLGAEAMDIYNNNINNFYGA